MFLFCLIWLLLFQPLYAADSLMTQAKRLSEAVAAQIKENKENKAAGRSSQNNYLIRYQSAPPEAFASVMRNNGEYFWKGLDEAAIRKSIEAKKSTLGGTEYYVVVASVFNYANTDFDTDETIDWAQVKKQQASRVNTDSAKNKAFLNSVFEYVKKQVNYQVTSTDFIINYFLTVFSVDKGQYTISYRTYVQYGASLSNLGVGLPTLDKDLIQHAKANKQQWILENINSDAYWVAQYKENKGDLAVMDYSRQLSFEQLQKLKELFAGKSPLVDEKGMQRHTLRCKLFITQQGTPTYASDTLHIGRYQPPQGQVALWIDFAGHQPEVKWLKYGDENTRRSYEEVVRSLQKEPLTFWQELLSSMPRASLSDMCSALYEVMDWMGKGIKYLEIPEYVWNCDKTDLYKEAYSDVFSVVLKPVTIVYDIGLKPMLSDYSATWGNQYERAKFAASVGLWNGLVLTAASIPEGIKLLTAIGKPNPEWNGIRHAVASECKLPDSSMCFSGFLRVVWNGIRDMHDTRKPCVFAHALGNDAFLIISAFVSGGSTLAGSAAGQTIKTFLAVLNKLDVIGLAVGKFTGLGMKVVMQTGGRPVVSFLNKAGQEVFRLVEQNGVKSFYYVKAGVATLVDWSNASGYRWATLNGQPYKVHFGELLNNNLQQARLQIKQYLNDAEGHVIKNAEGDALALVGKEGSEAAEDNTVAVVQRSMSQTELEDLYNVI